MPACSWPPATRCSPEPPAICGGSPRRPRARAPLCGIPSCLCIRATKRSLYPIRSWCSTCPGTTPSPSHRPGAGGRARRHGRGGAAICPGVCRCACGPLPPTLCRLAGLAGRRKRRAPPYKLQRTTGYIQTHLEEKLALATLAAVAEMSPHPFCTPVQGRDRVDAPPVREPVPDRARQTAARRHRLGAHRGRGPGRLCGPKSLHRALSDARRHDPQSLQKRRTACVRRPHAGHGSPQGRPAVARGSSGHGASSTG